MSIQILSVLKRKIDEISMYGGIDAETKRNALKEELQFYVLDFIYHHKEYSKWIMYEGSALRIIHGLDRMSVDLDFEVSNEVTEDFLKELKVQIDNHFANTYGTDSYFLTTKIVNRRGLKLVFNVGKELELGHPSDQIHIKIDLNYFIVPKTAKERVPINRGQLSFVILTYNFSALMASKLAAIFLRNSRGVGDAIYEEKGRDIYDLLWYMGKKIVPDFDYLIAKDVDIKDPRALFDKLTIQMNKVSDENLKNDLLPLFLDQNFINNWLKNWRESYLRLVDDYKIRIIKELEKITINQDQRSDNFSFTFLYKTEDDYLVRIVCIISDYWIDFREGDLTIDIDSKLEKKIIFVRNGINETQAPQEEKLKQYASLFYEKIKKYQIKTNNIILGDGLITKTIRMTSNNLNQKEQIVINRSALLACELDDLVK